MDDLEVLPAHIREPELCRRRTGRLGGLVTRPFGVRLDDTTSQRWMEVVSLFRIIDDFLDGVPSDNFEERTALVRQKIKNPGIVTKWFPTLTPESLGEDAYRQIETFGDRIVRLNHFIKTTDSPDRYLSLRRAEGRESARLLVALASPAMQQQAHFERFKKGMDMVGETINLLDSFLDIGGDARRGEINFQPSLGFRAKLLGNAACVAVSYLPAVYNRRAS